MSIVDRKSQVKEHGKNLRHIKTIVIINIGVKDLLFWLRASPIHWTDL